MFKSIKIMLLLFAGYAVLNAVLFFIMGTINQGVYPDYQLAVNRLFQGEFIGTRYPPLHVLWSALRLKISQVTHIPYIILMQLIYFPLLVATWLQIKKIAAHFLKEAGWQNLAAWLFILYPLYFLSLHLDLSLIPYTFFLLVAVNFLLKVNPDEPPQQNIPYLIKAGLFVGLSALFRPTPMLLTPIILIPWFIPEFNKNSRQKLSFIRFLLFTAILMGTFFATISPWSVYASSRQERIVILSDGLLPSHRDGFRRYPPLYTKKIINKRIGSLSDAFEFHKEYFQKYPLTHSMVWIKKALACWYGSDSGKWELPFGIINLLYLSLALIGLLKSKWSPQTGILLILILYHWFLSTIVLSIARYQVPVFPYITIFAVVGIKHLLERTENSRGQTNE